MEYEFENSALVGSELLSAPIDPDPPKPDTPDDSDTPPVVTSPTTVDPDPEKPDNNMIYYGIAVLIGAITVSIYWTKNRLE